MYLGIDYGSKRIGLATVEQDSTVVLPFGIIENRGSEYVIAEINRIVSAENIKEIVVGLPIGLSGKDTEKTKETQEFIDILAKKMTIPVIPVDERLSSKLADELARGTKGSRDVGSAMIILESYIMRNKKQWYDRKHHCHYFKAY